eukprot:1221199-Pleurochrysis_carterae.AAC.1
MSGFRVVGSLLVAPCWSRLHAPSCHLFGCILSPCGRRLPTAYLLSSASVSRLFAILLLPRIVHKCVDDVCAAAIPDTRLRLVRGSRSPFFSLHDSHVLTISMRASCICSADADLHFECENTICELELDSLAWTQAASLSSFLCGATRTLAQAPVMCT